MKKLNVFLWVLWMMGVLAFEMDDPDLCCSYRRLPSLGPITLHVRNITQITCNSQCNHVSIYDSTTCLAIPHINLLDTNFLLKLVTAC